jgi:hypothetical protein
MVQQMTAIYKKVGRRYVEIGVHQNEAYYYPNGATLVWAREGNTLTRYGIDPADAALLAAGQRMEDSMLEAMRKATEFKPQSRKYTKNELVGWEAYKKVAGVPTSLVLEGASMQDVVKAGIDVLIDAVKAKK